MHILIAEDDTVSRSMLVMLLRGRGYTIEEAADGGEAWGMLQAVDAPRLVILDWMMPVMDGLDVCRRLRERRGDDYTYVIMQTAKATAADMKAGYAAGVDDYLVKPIDLQNLLQRLRVGERILAYETRQREARRELAAFAVDMQTLAEERAKQLVNADRLVTLGTLSAGIAHEINNPATFIAGNAEMIEKAWELLQPRINNADDNPQVAFMCEEMPAMLRGIREGVERITRIVGSLKQYARQDVRRATPFAWRSVIDNAQLLCASFLKGRVTMELDIPEGMPMLMGDERQIEQVVVNLLSNAADALQGRRDARVVVAIKVDGEYARITVQDNGPGISKPVADRVFDPFFTTKPEGRGTGLGLSISKTIVEAHGGILCLVNAPEGGAVFTFTLPLAGHGGC